ncbi:MAG TPA: quinone oxidoreductase [Myxococcales bacterium]|nr:quinone oxidoreductase [Myxococcales bacterium]
MRAIRAEKQGGPEVMQLVDVATPKPGAGQVLIRVEAAGVNFIDIYQRSGVYVVPLPLSMGLEGAGTIEELGGGVEGLKTGMRVAWAHVQGSYATHLVAPAEKLVAVPEGVSPQLAAAIMLQGSTAHYLVNDTFPLQAGQTCLVHAAAGGVGLILCQLAKKKGARIIGTVGNEEKAALARGAGADELVIYARQDFEAEARRITGGKGVDVVYDSVGKDTWERSLRSLRPRGMMVLFGQSSGAVPPINPQLLNQHGSLFFTRPSLVHYTATRAELLGRATALFGLIRDGKLSVRIGATVPLAQAAQAHEMLAARKTTGKVLLQP